MFGADVPVQFGREYGCTVAEWARDLPGAVGAHRLDSVTASQAQVLLARGGCLHLQWLPLPPRQIALVRLPRLQVDFRFDAVPPEARAGFMRYFDLFMQRGGG